MAKCRKWCANASNVLTSVDNELMNLLALETTCDETAAAVVTDRLEVLASVVASQDELHRRSAAWCRRSPRGHTWNASCR